MDCSKWRKLIKDVQWPGWVWVGECFFWYQPTWVVPDQRLLNGCVCFISFSFQIHRCCSYVKDFRLRYYRHDVRCCCLCSNLPISFRVCCSHFVNQICFASWHPKIGRGAKIYKSVYALWWVTGGTSSEWAPFSSQNGFLLTFPIFVTGSQILSERCCANCVNIALKLPRTFFWFSCGQKQYFTYLSGTWGLVDFYLEKTILYGIKILVCVYIYFW